MRTRLKYAVHVIAGLMAAAAPPRAAAQVFEELYAFTDGTNGTGPQGALIQATDGNFYGTTTEGGQWGCGTVFKVTPEGALTTLASFNCTNGQFAYGALLLARDGNCYGTTVYGWGDGTIFRITPNGVLTSLWAFYSPYNGAHPHGDLAQGADGFLYGVTEDGGEHGYGTIFKISTNGSGFATLFAFDIGGPGGFYPTSGLLLASDGNFYGVTGGDPGAVYRMTTNGTVATLASFQPGPGNALWPFGKLLEASDGNFYGGAGGGSVGTIFRMTRDGMLTTFARFACYAGQGPVGGLVEANDGDIYGCAYRGGSNFSFGTVFRLDPTHGCTDNSWNCCGNLYPLVWFGDNASGAYPYAGLVQAGDGNLYGTTANGGWRGAGNIFRFIMPGPRLTIDRQQSATNQVVLSWRTNYAGFTLQSSADLASTNWLNWPNQPAISGRRFWATNSLSPGPGFFRLKK